MKHFYVILSSLILILPQPVHSQNNDKAAFQYELGLELGSAREDLLIPLAFHGPGVVLGLGIQKISGPWEWSMNNRVKLDFLFNRLGHPGASTALDIEPGLLRHVYTLRNELDLYAGSSLRYQMNNLFLFSWDDAHLYWTTIRGLNLDLRLRKAVGQKRWLSLDISIPLFTQVSRPEIQRLEKQDPSLMSLGFLPPQGSRDFTTATYDVYSSVGIEIKLVNMGAGSAWLFGFDFDHYSQPEDVRLMSTTLSFQKQISRRVKS